MGKSITIFAPHPEVESFNKRLKRKTKAKDNFPQQNHWIIL